MRKTFNSLLVITMCFIASLAIAADYVKATDIQRVNLGENFDQVTQKIGQPNQILSKERTSDGKEQVTWSFESVSPPNFNSFIAPAAEDQLQLQAVYQQQRINNPPYLVVFIDGKVSSIKRKDQQ